MEKPVKERIELRQTLAKNLELPEEPDNYFFFLRNIWDLYFQAVVKYTVEIDRFRDQMEGNCYNVSKKIKYSSRQAIHSL